MKGSLFQQVKVLPRYREGRLDTSVLEQLVPQVPVTGIELSALLSGRKSDHGAYLRMHIFHRLAAGRLSFDPRAQPLDDHTLLFSGGQVHGRARSCFRLRELRRLRSSKGLIPNRRRGRYRPRCEDRDNSGKDVKSRSRAM